MGAYEISLFSAMVILLIAVLLLMILVLLFFLRRQRQQQEKLKRQAAEEVNRMEVERSRLAMDLHDDLRSLLTVARLQLMLVREGGANVQEGAARACACVDELAQRLQQIASHLSPRMVAVQGLEAGLDSLAKSIACTAGFRVGLQYRLQSEVPPETRGHLYRIAQELLQNAVKHSAAAQVYLRLEEGKKTIRLLYRDDGKGFVYREDHPGLGLSHLRNRVELLNGKMQCRTEPGRGTHYLFQIPKILPDGNKD